MRSLGIKQLKSVFCSKTCQSKHKYKTQDNCDYCDTPCETKYCKEECERKAKQRRSKLLKKRDKAFWASKIKIVNELGNKCSSCGTDNYKVLDIDHIDRSKKKMGTFGRYRLADWERNKGNLRLLCSNCHRIRSWDQLGWDGGVSIIQKNNECNELTFDI